VLAGLIEVALRIGFEGKVVVDPAEPFVVLFAGHQLEQCHLQPSHLLEVACIDRVSEQVAGGDRQSSPVAQLGGARRQPAGKANLRDGARVHVIEVARGAEQSDLLLSGHGEAIEQPADQLVGLPPEHVGVPQRPETEGQLQRSLDVARSIASSSAARQLA